MRLTPKAVEIFLKGERIAVHLREKRATEPAAVGLKLARFFSLSLKRKTQLHTLTIDQIYLANYAQLRECRKRL